MPCYCNDISRINKDIQTLNSMLNKVNSISSRDTNQNSVQKSLSANAVGSATPANISSLSEKTGRLNEKIATNRANMSRRISSEISSLRTRLSSLQTADRRYHDSLIK